MSRIIKRSTFHETETFHLVFDLLTTPGAGYAFPCDRDGVIDRDALPEPARASLTRVESEHPDLYRAPRVEKREHSWREPAILRCDCGAEVELDGFTNTCGRCDADYNSAGQRLAPREFWGEETGETLADILGPQTESDCGY